MATTATSCLLNEVASFKAYKKIENKNENENENENKDENKDENRRNKITYKKKKIQIKQK